MSILKRWSKYISRLHTAIFFVITAAFLFTFSAWQSRGVIIFDRDEEESVTKVELPKHVATPESVRAIYMSSWVAGTVKLRENLVEFVETSEINSIVIDVKDYSGKISFEVDDPFIDRMQSEEKRIRDIREFIEYLHSKEIYVIARVTVFQDPHAARARPDLAVGKKGGGVWHDRKGLAYIDPGAQEYWKYTVAIARASERVGFDEINFDYIRFPSDGMLSLAQFPFMNGRTKVEVLDSFFVYLRQELITLPVPISADIFGLTTWNSDDLNIGQILEHTARHFDYVAPMVYPSHYSANFQGFKNPALYPYEIVSTAMERASTRLKEMGQDPKKLRPWIQDFDLGANYGPEEIKKQKKAIYDSGLGSWMAWDPSNVYTKEAYYE